MTDNKLIAEVNGKEIFESDVYDLMAGIEDRDRFNSKEGFNILADEVVNQELLLNDALDKGLDKDEEFARELELVRNNMLKNYAMHKIFDQVTITDDEVRDYYEKNKDTLFSPFIYTASHILVENEDQAKKIKTELDNGLDFGEAARKYSIDPSAQNGGSLGQFPKGIMVKEFQDGLDTIEVGEISEPIKSEFGYHIIKLTDKTTDERNYDDIKEQVKSTYEMGKRQDKYLEVINELLDKSEVKKYY